MSCGVDSHNRPCQIHSSFISGSLTPEDLPQTQQRRLQHIIEDLIVLLEKDGQDGGQDGDKQGGTIYVKEEIIEPSETIQRFYLFV